MDDNQNIVREQFEKNFNKKKMPKIVKIIIAVICLALGVTGFILYKEFSKPLFNLNRYITVEASGYNGYGSIDVDFSEDYLYQDICNETDFSKSRRLDLFEAIEDNMDYEIVADDNLKNGDTYQIVWKVDKKRLEKRYKIKILSEDKTYKVSGLQEPEKYDPFKDLEVTFSGVSPNGKLDDNPIYADNKGLKIEFDKTEGLRNGDVVTAKVTADVRDCVEYLGIEVVNTEKEYTVSGLPEYIETVEDLSEDELQTMVSDAEDGIRSHIAKKWDDPETLIGLDFAGVYYLTAKPNVKTYSNNIIYIVHKITASNDSCEGGQFEYYYYTRYRNLMRTGDGVFSIDLTDKEVPEGGYGFIGVYGKAFKVGGYCYVGYEKIETLFSDCVTSDLDEFEYESTVK